MFRYNLDSTTRPDPPLHWTELGTWWMHAHLGTAGRWTRRGQGAGGAALLGVVTRMSR
jgi:hypothetical protein